MLTALMIAVVSATPAPEDLLDGAEIGNAEGFVAFESHGKYHAEKVDKARGNTVLRGTWTITGETVEARPATCKGPACKELNKPYKAEVQVVAERALLVKSIPADTMFPTGSYYCHYLGCEKRTGVELLSKNAKASAVNYVLDALIDKNRKRDVTIVWWGKKIADDVKKGAIQYCTREAERGKKGAELVQGDLAELPWIGKLEITESPEKDCLWDVRVLLPDDLAPPAKTR